MIEAWYKSCSMHSEICLYSLSDCHLLHSTHPFSQSPNTKQHVSDGPQIKTRNHLTPQDTESKFNCLMYYIFFILEQNKTFHFLHIDFIDCVWIAPFNGISHELQPTFSKMWTCLGSFRFWKPNFEVSLIFLIFKTGFIISLLKIRWL